MAVLLPSLSQASLLSAFPDPTIVLTYGSCLQPHHELVQLALIYPSQTNKIRTSVSAFRFHRSNLPLPSTAPNNAGWVGDHLTSYT
jgi:hypothetical protein